MRKTGEFSSEKEFQKVYAETVEQWPDANEEIRSNYKSMREFFEKYIDALDERTFRYAYQCGYKAAMEKFGVVKMKGVSENRAS